MRNQDPAKRPRRTRYRRPETTADAIRRRIKALVTARGWSQRTLAKEMGWAQSTIHQFLRVGSDRTLDVRQVEQAATALDVPVQTLLVGDDPESLSMAVTVQERLLLDYLRAYPHLVVVVRLVTGLVRLTPQDYKLLTEILHRPLPNRETLQDEQRARLARGQEMLEKSREYLHRAEQARLLHVSD